MIPINTNWSPRLRYDLFEPSQCHPHPKNHHQDVRHRLDWPICAFSIYNCPCGFFSSLLFHLSEAESGCESFQNSSHILLANNHIAQAATLAPWFPPHLQRNIYLSLLHLEPEEGKEKAKVPDSVLRAALLRRAVEDVNRIIQVRTAKQACSTLLQRGSVGDDLWQRFLRAEKEMQEELRDVVMEVRN
jgi:hypothetical protein